MAFEAFSLTGIQNGAPGLIFNTVPHVVENGIIKADKNSEGGFVCFRKIGDANGVYLASGDDKVFAGIALRVTGRDEYKSGDPCSVIVKGKVWVRVLGEVTAHSDAYYNSTNYSITATSVDGVKIGKFTSNATDGGLAELVLG